MWAHVIMLVEPDEVEPVDRTLWTQVMNQARRLKRIRKEAAAAAQAAAEAAVPTKKIKFVGDGKGVGKIDERSDGEDHCPGANDDEDAWG